MLLKKIVELKKHYLFLFLLFSTVVLIFLTYKNYGVTWDEFFYVKVGRHYTREILNFFKVPNNITQYGTAPDDIHLRTHGVFFDVFVILLTPLFQTFNFEIYHLIKALLSLFSLIFLYLVLIKLMSKKGALLGVILLLLFPRFYGDIFNNSIDIPTLMFFSLYVIFFLRFIDKKDSLIRLILLSLSLALLINQRIIFLYVFLLTCIFLINKLKNIFLLSILTFTFLHITHPYLWQHPLVGFIEVLKTSNNFPFTAANLFEGLLIPANLLPWYYIPKLIVITTPLSTLCLFLVGNIYLLLSIINKKISSNLKQKYIFFLALFYIPLMIIIIMRPALYDSWRHFLFLTIPLIIIAVFGAKVIFSIKNNLIKIFLLCLIAVNLFQTILEMRALHPYQYIYYNQLVGGLKGASDQYETDYWGAANREAVLWFNKNINDPKKTYYIITEGDPLSSTYYFKKNMFFTYDYNRANYAISFTRWNSQQKYSGKTIHTIDRLGVPLIYIKENP